MTNNVIVFVTCESREEAERIAAALVGERLAACVNVVPGVRSCYVWEGQLAWSEEVLCLMKTTRDGFAALRDRVAALHSYSVPEIVSVAVDDVNGSYSDWIQQNVG